MSLPGSSSAASATRIRTPGPGKASCSPPGATTPSSPTTLTPAQDEEQHRGHAVTELLLANLNDGPLAACIHPSTECCLCGGLCLDSDVPEERLHADPEVLVVA